MTVQEKAIDALRRIQKDEAHKMVGFSSIAHGDYDAEVNNCNMIDVAIQALEEVEQYRALGNVEELKEAKEKQIPKKPKIIKQKYHNSHTCPFCDLELICSDETGWFAGKRHKYCPDCGQAIDWEEGGTSEN